MVEKERLVRLDVAADDPQQKVRLSHHRVALENFRVLTHRLFEAQQRVATVSHQFHMGENGYVQPNFLAVEKGDSLADDTQLLQAAHASPAGRRGHAEPLGDIRGREVTVLLNEVQDSQITAIELNLHRLSHHAALP